MEHIVVQRKVIPFWVSLIGHYMLPLRIIGSNYLTFFQQVFPKILAGEHISASMQQTISFKHDGGP